MIDISGLDKATLLAALYNASSPQGMGFLHFDAQPMTPEDAQAIIASFGTSRPLYFDYLKGRVMKINLTKDEMDEWGYDRDLGTGAAQRVVDALRVGAAQRL